MSAGEGQWGLWPSPRGLTTSPFPQPEARTLSMVLYRWQPVTYRYTLKPTELWILPCPYIITHLLLRVSLGDQLALVLLDSGALWNIILNHMLMVTEKRENRTFQKPNIFQ